MPRRAARVLDVLVSVHSLSATYAELPRRSASDPPDPEGVLTSTFRAFAKRLFSVNVMFDDIWRHDLVLLLVKATNSLKVETSIMLHTVTSLA